MTDYKELHTNFRFIVSGGPGSGKTSLIEALNKEGFITFPELAAELISMGIRPGHGQGKVGQGRFFSLILDNRIRYHQQINSGETAFYDRGLPDSLAYFRYRGLPVPVKLTKAIESHRYHPVIFLAPPWIEIYSSVGPRQENFGEAARLHDLTVEAYQESGYGIESLPLAPVAERVRFVLDYVSRVTGRPIVPRNDR
jgi:predicted ATPase